MATTLPSKMFWRSGIAFIICVLFSLAAALSTNYLADRHWNNVDWLALLPMALFPLIFPSLVIFIAYFLLYPRLKSMIARPVAIGAIFFVTMLLSLFIIELTGVTFTIERYLRNNGYFIIFSFFTAIAMPFIYRRTNLPAKPSRSQPF